MCDIFKTFIESKFIPISILQDTGVLGWIFEKFVVGMILYFVVSIINSLAQSYHKRLHSKKKKNANKQH